MSNAVITWGLEGSRLEPQNHRATWKTLNTTRALPVSITFGQGGGLRNKHVE